MNVPELEKRCSVVEVHADRNVSEKIISGLTARATWEIALQVAKLVEILGAK